jgi:hypothetical protein
LASLIVRFLIVAFLGDIENPKTYEHGEIATHLLAGDGFTMHWPYPAGTPERALEHSMPPPYQGAFIPPLNPYIIYFFYSIFGIGHEGYLAIMIFNF